MGFEFLYPTNYNANNLFNGSAEIFKAKARRLLGEIAVVRDDARTPQPMAFICHGLGGLIVEAVGINIPFSHIPFRFWH